MRETTRWAPRMQFSSERMPHLAHDATAPQVPLALRLARIARWRRDQPAVAADTLENLRQLAESTAAA